DNISYSCDENILKQYFYNDYIPIIDDRKLITGEISFDSKEFDYIAYGEYITPYNFDFYDIIRI
ncbi:MAG: hypothetical protein K2J32_04305, partial [Ruminococcus sp.]|nr:hypothetical protein [Ruminococcus sp.]